LSVYTPSGEEQFSLLKSSVSWRSFFHNSWTSVFEKHTSLVCWKSSGDSECLVQH